MDRVTLMMGLLLGWACTASAQSAMCDEYCGLMAEACQGETLVYADEAECQAACAEFPTDGPEEAIAGDSVQCRVEHAHLALGEEGPVKHCPHAAPGGGGVCVDRTPCQAYCLFYFDRVTEEECPMIPEWGDDIGSVEQGTGDFEVSEPCLQACTGFAGSGASGETSGDTANCRLYFYLLAHREPDAEKRATLCQNAHPTQSPMCTGAVFDELYTRGDTDACRELCFHDAHSCGGQYGAEADCLEACRGLEPGERGDVVGGTAHCRLTYALNATLTTDDAQEQVLCRFAGPQSSACREGGRPGVLTPMGHGPQRRPDAGADAESGGESDGCAAAPGGERPAPYAVLALLALGLRRRRA